MVDDDALAGEADFPAQRRLDRQFSRPAMSPKSILSSAAQTTQRSSVTRATAANPRPVVSHTTSRILGIASKDWIVSISIRKSLAITSGRFMGASIPQSTCDV